MRTSLILLALIASVTSAYSASVSYPSANARLADPNTWSAPYTMLRERMAVSNQGAGDNLDYRGWWYDTYFGLAGSAPIYLPTLTIPVREDPVSPTPAATNHIRRAYIGRYGGTAYQPNITDHTAADYWPIHNAPIPWVALELNTLVRDVVDGAGATWVSNKSWAGTSPGDVDSLPATLGGQKYVRALRDTLIDTEYRYTANVGPGTGVWSNYLLGTLSATDAVLPDAGTTTKDGYWGAATARTARNLGAGWFLEEHFSTRRLIRAGGLGFHVLNVSHPTVGGFSGSYVWNPSKDWFESPYTGRTVARRGSPLRILVSQYEVNTTIAAANSYAALGGLGLSASGATLPRSLTISGTTYNIPGVASMLPTGHVGDFLTYASDHWRWERSTDSTKLEFYCTNNNEWYPLRAVSGIPTELSSTRYPNHYIDADYVLGVWPNETEVRLRAPITLFSTTAQVPSAAGNSVGLGPQVGGSGGTVQYDSNASALMTRGATLEGVYSKSGSIPLLDNEEFSIERIDTYSNTFVKASDLRDNDIIGRWTIEDHAYVLNDYRAAKYAAPNGEFSVNPAFRPFLGAARSASYLSPNIPMARLEGNAKLAVTGSGQADGYYAPPFGPMSWWVSDADGTLTPGTWKELGQSPWPALGGGANEVSDDNYWPAVWKLDANSPHWLEYIAYTPDAKFVFTGGYDGAFDAEKLYTSMGSRDWDSGKQITPWSEWDGAYPYYRLDGSSAHLELWKRQDSSLSGNEFDELSILVKLPTPYGSDTWRAWQYNGSDRWYDKDNVYRAPADVHSNAWLQVIQVPEVTTPGGPVTYSETLAIIPDGLDTVVAPALDGAIDAPEGSYDLDYQDPPGEWAGPLNLTSNTYYVLVQTAGAYSITLDTISDRTWPYWSYYRQDSHAHLDWYGGRIFLAADAIESAADDIDDLSGFFESLRRDHYMPDALHTNGLWQIQLDAEATGDYTVYADLSAFDGAYPLPDLTIGPATGYDVTNAANMVSVTISGTGWEPSSGISPLTSDAFLEVSVGGSTLYFNTGSPDGFAFSSTLTDVPLTPDTAGTVPTTIQATLKRVIYDIDCTGTYYEQRSATVEIDLFTVSDAVQEAVALSEDPGTFTFSEEPTPYYPVYGTLTGGSDLQVTYLGVDYPANIYFPFFLRESACSTVAANWLTSGTPASVAATSSAAAVYVPGAATPIVPSGAYIGSVLKIRNPGRRFVYDVFTNSSVADDDAAVLELDIAGTVVVYIQGAHVIEDTEDDPAYGEYGYTVYASTIPAGSTNGVILSKGKYAVEAGALIYPWPREYGLYRFSELGDDIDEDVEIAAAGVYAFVYTNAEPGAIVGIYEPVVAGGDVIGSYEITVPHWRQDRTGFGWSDTGAFSGNYVPVGGLGTNAASVAVMNHTRYSGYNDLVSGYKFGKRWDTGGGLAIAVPLPRADIEDITLNAVGMAVTTDEADNFYPDPVAGLPAGTTWVIELSDDEEDFDLELYDWRLEAWWLPDGEIVDGGFHTPYWNTNDVVQETALYDPSVGQSMSLYYVMKAAGAAMNAHAAGAPTTNYIETIASGGGELRIAKESGAEEDGDYWANWYMLIGDSITLPTGATLEPVTTVRRAGRLMPPAATPYLGLRQRDNRDAAATGVYVAGASAEILAQARTEMELYVYEYDTVNEILTTNVVATHLSGWCTTLEQWLEEHRLRVDPTIVHSPPWREFEGYGVKYYHEDGNLQTTNVAVYSYWELVSSVGFELSYDLEIIEDLYSEVQALPWGRPPAGDATVILENHAIVEFTGMSDAAKPTNPEDYDLAEEP